MAAMGTPDPISPDMTFYLTLFGMSYKIKVDCETFKGQTKEVTNKLLKKCAVCRKAKGKRDITELSCSHFCHTECVALQEQVEGETPCPICTNNFSYLP